MTRNTGEQIVQLVHDTDEALLVVSPFITRPAFKHLLAILKARPLVVVTDWRPAAVAAGATDPRIINDVAARTRTDLFLLPSLHGKLYWTRHQALIGSTNLTGRGTGWFGPGNFELLVRADPEDPAIRAFVDDIIEFCVEATPAAADAAIKAAEQQPAVPAAHEPQPVRLLRTPVADFFEQYAAGDLAEGARADAETLNVPAGLEPDQFVRHLQRQLQALPFHSLASRVSQRTGASGSLQLQREEFYRTAAAYGFEQPASEADADHAWAVLMSWMVDILPKDFTTLETGPRVLVSSAGVF